jgi:hypothetical protein
LYLPSIPHDEITTPAGSVSVRITVPDDAIVPMFVAVTK